MLFFTSNSIIVLSQTIVLLLLPLLPKEELGDNRAGQCAGTCFCSLPKLQLVWPITGGSMSLHDVYMSNILHSVNSHGQNAENV